MTSVIHTTELYDAIREIAKQVIAELKDASGKLTLTTKEAAELCNVSNRTVQVWVRSGLKTVQEHPYLILREDLTEYLRNRSQARGEHNPFPSRVPSPGRKCRRALRFVEGGRQ